MRSKFLAGIVLCLLLFGIATAQEYSIRANRDLNLRAAPNLDAAIADTVPAGAVLRVLGRSGSWLQISGGAGDVWLADWVDYSRVDRLEQTGSQPQPAQIDNCCFVDRQCHSDQEWTQGYWAYQNNQCPAPAQKPAQPSSPPAAAVSSQVDNCCFVDRQCHTDQEWAAGYWAFQNNHCPSSTQSPPGRTSRPRVEGSNVSIRQIEATLNLLQNRAPQWYDYVISGLDRIIEVPSQPEDPLSCIARANGPERTATAQTGCAFTSTNCRSQRMWWVGRLAHEACHIHTYEAGINYAAMGIDEEKVCGKIGREATLAVDSAWANIVVFNDLNHTRVSLGQPIIIPTC